MCSYYDFFDANLSEAPSLMVAVMDRRTIATYHRRTKLEQNEIEDDTSCLIYSTLDQVQFDTCV